MNASGNRISAPIGAILLAGAYRRLAYSRPMKALDEPRQYLLDALLKAGANLKEASEMAGMNHAYLQQFIKLGKPRFLPESVREALVRLYQIDGDKLRPPAARPRRQIGKRTPGAKGRPSSAEFIKDADELALVLWWRSLSRPEKRLVTSMMGPPAITETGRDDG